MTPYTVVNLAFVILFATSTVFAQERTAAIIETLAGDIAAEMAKYRETRESRSTETARIQSAYDETDRALADATDPVVEEELKARLLKNWADLNALELSEVTTSLNMLDRIVPMLHSLKGHLLLHQDEHGGEPRSLGANGFRYVAGTIAIVADQLKRQVTSPSDVADLSDIERKLVSEVNQRSEPFGTKASMESLDTALKSLEALYTDVLQAQRVFELERFQLSGLAAAQVAEIVAIKLGKALNSIDVHRLGGAVLERVGARRRRYEAVEDGGIAVPRRGGSPISPIDAETLRRLRERRPDDR